MKIDYSESVMQHDCLRRMRAAKVITGIEICHWNHMIDLAWITDEHRIYLVELKLTDWRTALKQAKYHLDEADFVSVAMPPRQITKPIKQAFMESGIGFLEYQRPVEFGESDFSHPFVVQIMPRLQEGYLKSDFNKHQEIYERIKEQHRRSINEARAFVRAFGE